MMRSPSRAKALQVQEEVATLSILVAKETTIPDTIIAKAVVITALTHGVFTTIAEPMTVLSHIIRITYNIP